MSEQKEKRLNIRVTEKEYTIIRTRAKSQGVSVSQYILDKAVYNDSDTLLQRVNSSLDRIEGKLNGEDCQ